MVMRPCLDCGTPSRGSRCVSCTRDRDRARGTRTQRGYGYAYQQARIVVLERDGYVCQLRRVGCTHYATTVDHLVPKVRGGSDELDNLVAACLPCNSGKRDRVA